MPDLISSGHDDYIYKATDLFHQPPRLHAIQEKMRHKDFGRTIFDIDQYASDFENEILKIL